MSDSIHFKRRFLRAERTEDASLLHADVFSVIVHLGCVLICVLAVTPLSAQVVINELLASNGNFGFDEEGEAVSYTHLTLPTTPYV